MNYFHVSAPTPEYHEPRANPLLLPRDVSIADPFPPGFESGTNSGAGEAGDGTNRDKRSGDLAPVAEEKDVSCSCSCSSSVM
jgi:hypothetical protein